MSWSFIVTTSGSKKKKAKSQLLVRYNIQTPVIDKKTDSIPRHKEITPDPWDDFTMTNSSNINITIEETYIHPGMIMEMEYQKKLKALLRTKRDELYLKPWPKWKYGEWIDYTKIKIL